MHKQHTKKLCVPSAINIIKYWVGAAHNSSEYIMLIFSRIALIKWLLPSLTLDVMCVVMIESPGNTCNLLCNCQICSRPNGKCDNTGFLSVAMQNVLLPNQTEIFSLWKSIWKVNERNFE